MYKKEIYIDATALVESNAELGFGVSIWNWSKVRDGACIGENTSVGQCVYIDSDVVIGKQCKLQNGISVYKGVTLGDDVFVGPHAVFTNDLTPRAHGKWNIIPTHVEDGVSIGANATIVCGVRLGKNSMVGAGAVVTQDVPAHALVMGVPARIVDYVNISGKRLCVDPSLGVPEDEKLLAE